MSVSQTVNPSLSALEKSSSAADVLAGRILHYLDRHRRWFFLGILLLYLAGFNGQWHIEPDTALYLTVARNLAEGKGYTYHDQPHHLAYPGWPYLVAGTFKVFGVGALWPAHVLMLLFGLGTLGLTCWLMRLHAGRATAVLITCMVGLSETFFRYTIELRNDMPFLFGVMAFLVGYEAIFARPRPDPIDPQALPPPSGHRTRWYHWGVMSLGLVVAVTMRPTMIPFVLLVAALLLISIFRRGRGKTGGVILLGLLVGAVVLFHDLDPRRHGAAVGGYEKVMFVELFHHFGDLLHKAIFENLPALFESSIAEASFGHEIGPGLNTLFGLLMLLFTLRLFRRRVLWGAWIWVTVGMLLLTMPKDRYFLAVLPLLAYAWWRGAVWIGRRAGPAWGNLLLVLLLLLWAGPNTVKTVRLVFEQRQMPFLAHYKSGRYPAIIELAGQIKAETPPQATILCPAKLGRILTFFSHRRVLEGRDLEFESRDGKPNKPAPPSMVVLPIEEPDDTLTPVLRDKRFQLASPIATIPRRGRKGRGAVPWTLNPIVAAGGAGP